ncbi:MAG: ribonuclease HI [bacterium]|nr:ribonuclease HI [bacterium]
MKQVEIYTDGACTGNPGPGGYGVILRYGEHRKELSGGFRLTTNNRMEILAAIVGLEALRERCQVILYSDSRYLVDSINKRWVFRWKANGWMRDKKERVPNADLWERLLKLLQLHSVEFRWVRGHNGQAENERCDQLATAAAARGQDLPEDPGYTVATLPGGKT